MEIFIHTRENLDTHSALALQLWIRVWYLGSALILFEHFMHFHLEKVSEQWFLLLRLNIHSHAVLVISSGDRFTLRNTIKAPLIGQNEVMYSGWRTKILDDTVTLRVNLDTCYICIRIVDTTVFFSELPSNSYSLK